MRNINYLLAFFMLISVNFNVVLAANNFKLQAYGDADSDAALLVTAGTYGDAATAQKAIFHYDVASPWKFGTYESATQNFFVYTADNALWNGGSQWEILASNGGGTPIVYEGHTFQSNNGFSPVIFFVAPEDAIYKVNTNFEYQSGNGDTQGSTLFQFKAKDGSSVVNMNFGANYTANDRIHASDFFVNLHAGDTITFNQACTVWGDPFCQWKKLQVLGNNSGAAFTSTEANESGFYFDNYVVATDFSFLNAKITASESLKGATVIGTYPASATTAFQSAIDAANSFVSDQPNATQLEVNAQLATLSTAYTTFANSYIGANNYKLYPYDETGSDANLLVTAGTYGDVQTAEKAIIHNDVASPWKFGTYESATQKFMIYTDANANWNGGSQWQTLNDGTSPIVWEGHSFQHNNGFSPVFFFVAPVAAIYKVNTNFEYQSGNGDTQGSTLFQFKANDGSSVVNMNFGANYTASNRTHASDFFVNLHAGDTITFNQACTVWGDPFCQWKRLQVVRDNGGVAYSETDATASGSYFDNYVVTFVKNQKETNTLKIIDIENGIRIMTDKVVTVSVYTIAGVKVKSCIVNSEEVISLLKGAYIVKSGNTIQKVLVR